MLSCPGCAAATAAVDRVCWFCATVPSARWPIQKRESGQCMGAMISPGLGASGGRNSGTASQSFGQSRSHLPSMAGSHVRNGSLNTGFRIPPLSHRVLTTGHAGCTFTAYRMQHGGNAGKREIERTPMDLVRKHKICRRFAVLREKPLRSGKTLLAELRESGNEEMTIRLPYSPSQRRLPSARERPSGAERRASSR